MKMSFLSRIGVLSVIMILSFATFNIAYSQKAIQLSKSSGKKILLKEGDRISYFLKDTTRSVTGVVEKINQESFSVSGKEIKIENVLAIGRKKKGSAAFATLGTMAGTAIIIGAIQSANYDPCPDCIDEGTTGEGWTAVQIGLGAAIIGLSINTAVRNSRKDVTGVWKLEIVDVPVGTSK